MAVSLVVSPIGMADRTRRPNRILVQRGRGTVQYATACDLREPAVFRAALEEAGIPFKDGEVENTYRLLTDDDVSSGTRVQTRNELEHDGIPIDNVESDFVSPDRV